MKRETSSTDQARVFIARAEALVRALNGVAEARVELDDKASVRVVYVVAAPGVGGKALIRNVQSALMAVLNLKLEPGKVVLMPNLPVQRVISKTLGEPAAVSEPAAVAPAPIAPATRAVTPSATPSSNLLDTATKPRDRQWAAVGFSGSSPRAVYRPTPQIETLELHRFNPDQLQCKVVIELAGQRRIGTAIAGDERAGGVTLAARATLNALQTVEPADWVFEGAADVIISGQRHICVSLRKHDDGPSLSGAALVEESVEHAVARAVLNAAALAVTARKQNRRVAVK